jgi:hypothetical protein
MESETDRLENEEEETINQGRTDSQNTEEERQ